MSKVDDDDLSSKVNVFAHASSPTNFEEINTGGSTTEDQNTKTVLHSAEPSVETSCCSQEKVNQSAKNFAPYSSQVAKKDQIPEVVGQHQQPFPQAEEYTENKYQQDEPNVNVGPEREVVDVGQSNGSGSDKKKDKEKNNALDQQVHDNIEEHKEIINEEDPHSPDQKIEHAIIVKSMTESHSNINQGTTAETTLVQTAHPPITEEFTVAISNTDEPNPVTFSTSTFESNSAASTTSTVQELRNGEDKQMEPVVDTEKARKATETETKNTKRETEQSEDIQKPQSSELVTSQDSASN